LQAKGYGLIPTQPPDQVLYSPLGSQINFLRRIRRCRGKRAVEGAPKPTAPHTTTSTKPTATKPQITNPRKPPSSRCKHHLDTTCQKPDSLVPATAQTTPQPPASAPKKPRFQTQPVPRAPPVAQTSKRLAIKQLETPLTTEYGAEATKQILQTMSHNAEFVKADILGETFKDKVANFFERFQAKRSSKVCQCGGKLTAYEQQMLIDKISAEKYDAIRKCTTDVKIITKNTGMSEFKIKRVKQHAFYDDTHILDRGHGLFDPDLDIAKAWNHLVKNNFTPNDIKLLEHEYFESKFEKIFKVNARKAHDTTDKSGRKWKPD